MSGLNKATIIGRLGKDPTSRSMQNGDKVVSFSVATSESWNDKASGERKEKTEWHNVVIFNEPLGKIAEQYLKKGSQVYLEGALQTRKWSDKDGSEKYTTEIVLQRFRGEIVLIGDKGGSGGTGQSQGSGGTNKAQSTADQINDDIPF